MNEKAACLDPKRPQPPNTAWVNTRSPGGAVSDRRGTWSRHWFGSEYDPRCLLCLELGSVCEVASGRAEQETGGGLGGAEALQELRLGAAVVDVRPGEGRLSAV